MALQSSGAISLSQIQSEWGGSSPISLSEYYLGSLPSGRTNYGTIPSSGAIDIGDFYGTNSAVATQTIAIGNSSYVAATQYVGAVYGMHATDTNPTLINAYVSNHPIVTVNGRNTRWCSLVWGNNNTLGLSMADFAATSATYSGFPANSGWSTLTISGGASRTLSRSAAGFSGSTTLFSGGTVRSTAGWIWTGQSNIFPNSNNTTSFTLTIT
jgi:hypothetical protein